MWVLFTVLLLLIALILLISTWKRKGYLTAKRFALILAFFWSFSVLLAVVTFGAQNWQNIALGGGVAIFQFLITYFVSLWLYSRFYPD